MKISPLSDGVVVQAKKDDLFSSLGLVLPDTAEKKNLQKGEVVAVGPGRTENGQLIKPAVKKGDLVLFSPYGSPDKFDGKELYFLSESEVKAVLKK